MILCHYVSGSQQQVINTLREMRDSLVKYQSSKHHKQTHKSCHTSTVKIVQTSEEMQIKKMQISLQTECETGAKYGAAIVPWLDCQLATVEFIVQILTR